MEAEKSQICSHQPGDSGDLMVLIPVQVWVWMQERTDVTAQEKGRERILSYSAFYSIQVSTGLDEAHHLLYQDYWLKG